MVGIDFMIGPDPDVTDYFSSRSIGAKGGGGQNTTQYDNAEVDALLAEGAEHVRSWRSARRSTRRCRRSSGATCRSCRSSSTPWSRA